MDERRLSVRIFSLIISITLLISILGISGISYAAVSKEPRLNVKNLCLTRDSSYKLRVYNSKKSYSIEFNSNDTSIVTIKKSHTKSCTLKSKTSGTAIVTASVYNSEGEEVVILKCKVTVSPPAISVKFTKNKLRINEGDSKKLTAIVKPNVSSEQPRYYSDNVKVATVSSTGTVSGIGEGQTLIHACIANGKEDSYIVIVSKKDNQSNKNSDDSKNSDEYKDNSTDNTTSSPISEPTSKPVTATPAPTTKAPATVAPALPPTIPEPNKNYSHSKPKYKYDPFFINGSVNDPYDNYLDNSFDEHQYEYYDNDENYYDEDFYIDKDYYDKDLDRY